VLFVSCAFIMQHSRKQREQQSRLSVLQCSDAWHVPRQAGACHVIPCMM
jgi:hypothetical protein